MKNIKKFFLASTLMLSGVGFLGAMEMEDVGQPNGQGRESKQISAKLDALQASIQEEKEKLFRVLRDKGIFPENVALGKIEEVFLQNLQTVGSNRMEIKNIDAVIDQIVLNHQGSSHNNQQLAKVQEGELSLQLREECIGRKIEEVTRDFKEPVVNIIRAVAYINCPLLFFINLSLAQGMGIFEQHTTALFAMLKAAKRLYNCFLPTLFVNGFSSSLDSICMRSWAFIEVAFLLYEKILFIQGAPDFREKMKVIVGGLAFLTFFSVFVATV